MKNEFLRILEELGIAFKYLINGLIGGFVWSVYKKSKFWEGVRQIFIGGMVSGYFTPIVSKTLPTAAAGFTSFVIGMMGMVTIDSLYKYFVPRVSKWRKTIIELLK